MSIPVVRLRPAGAQDAALLLAVYASTRVEELHVTGWTDEEKAGFCAMQSAAQLSHYKGHYPSAEYYVIEVDGDPAGRLFVDRWAQEIRIMDIALLPAQRNRGIGSDLLADLQAEAAAGGKSLSIHVEQFNPALGLYTRLRFLLKEDKGVYWLMEWRSGIR